MVCWALVCESAQICVCVLSPLLTWLTLLSSTADGRGSVMNSLIHWLMIPFDLQPWDLWSASALWRSLPPSLFLILSSSNPHSVSPYPPSLFIRFCPKILQYTIHTSSLVRCSTLVARCPFVLSLNASVTFEVVTISVFPSVFCSQIRCRWSSRPMPFTPSPLWSHTVMSTSPPAHTRDTTHRTWTPSKVNACKRHKYATVYCKLLKSFKITMT